MANNTINVDKDGYVSIWDFSPWIDVTKVTYYKLKLTKNGKIIVKFYDKKKRLVRPYANK
jgi:hypothetical protein